MSDKPIIKRRADTVDITVHCFQPNCGKSRVLKFNGGDGDRWECCGYVHTLEIGLMNYVVRRK